MDGIIASNEGVVDELWDDVEQVDSEGDSESEVEAVKERVLGKGAHACVVEADLGGIRVAKKRVAKKTGKFGALERGIMNCGSRYIPKCHADSDKEICMELLPSRVRINPKDAARVGTFLCEAMTDIEKCYGPVVHADIKLENIGISRDGELKLFDFGSAVRLGVSSDAVSSEVCVKPLVKGGCALSGTPEITPPEGFKGECNVDNKFDSWAVGMLMYRMLRGSVHPFYEGEGTQNKRKFLLKMCDLANGDPVLAEMFTKEIEAVTIPEEVDSKIIDFMKGLLRINSEERLSLSEARLILSA